MMKFGLIQRLRKKEVVIFVGWAFIEVYAFGTAHQRDSKQVCGGQECVGRNAHPTSC